MAEKMSATAKGMSLPISRKQAVEVCRFIKRRDIAAVRRRLNRVLELKMAVPSTKFKRDIPHRSGSVGPGRFPIKAAKAILDVVNSAVSNAENKGMKASSLYIVKASACKDRHHGTTAGSQEGTQRELMLKLCLRKWIRKLISQLSRKQLKQSPRLKLNQRLKQSKLKLKQSTRWNTND